MLESLIKKLFRKKVNVKIKEHIMIKMYKVVTYFQ